MGDEGEEPSRPVKDLESCRRKVDTLYKKGDAQIMIYRGRTDSCHVIMTTVGNQRGFKKCFQICLIRPFSRFLSYNTTFRSMLPQQPQYANPRSLNHYQYQEPSPSSAGNSNSGGQTSSSGKMALYPSSLASIGYFNNNADEKENGNGFEV